jgi:hypothetical protein
VKWFFQRRPDGDEARHDEDDLAPGLIGLPAEVLQRHGAVVLDPGTAAAVHGYPTPRSTIYRARTLLVPGDLLEDLAFIEALNQVLRGVGMTLKPPGRDEQPPGRDEEKAGDGDVMEVLRELPRLAVLVPAEGATTPAVVDAWIALQALRATAAAPKHPEITKAKVEQIGLEHLLIGSAITGSPVTHGGGGITGGPGNGDGAAGPTSTDSYLFSGGDARTPVAVVMEPPERKTAAQCRTEYGRRPVLAVLDTGARVHEWLDVRKKRGGGYGTIADGFVKTDPGLQDAIRAEGERAAESGDRPREVIREPWDRPVSDDPLIGELDSDTGHSGAAVVSTFPTDINASRSPELRMRAHPGNELPRGVSLPGEREALDPDDYSGGFVVWSGTSFSAPLVAAHVVAALLNGAASAKSLRLNHPGAAAAKQRALAALTDLGWPG